MRGEIEPKPKIVTGHLFSLEETLKARSVYQGFLVTCEEGEEYSFIPDEVIASEHDHTVVRGACAQMKGVDPKTFGAANLLIIHPNGPNGTIIEEELHIELKF